VEQSSLSLTDRPASYDLARRIYEIRRWRDANCPGPYFGEPGWDILLQLFIAEGADGDRDSARKIFILFPNLWKRSIDQLIRDELIEVEPGDLFRLATKGREFMERVFHQDIVEALSQSRV
jgi:hypothetical protein